MDLFLKKDLLKTKTLIIIGFGYSGQRFLKAINYIIKQQKMAVCISGVIDSDPVKLLKLPNDIQGFLNLEEALDKIKPDIAIISVNEFQHYNILDQLCESSIRLIICEKPLTQSLAQAISIEKKLNGRFISMNMVERFSPIVSECRHWLTKNLHLKVQRIEFFWGKHRLRDIRPSMGICSEVIHPIDLIKFLFINKEIHLNTSFGIVSDMQNKNENILDSIFIMFTADECPIVGQSSFVWPNRDRRIITYLSNNEELIRITLNFDSPRWDCDSLVIDSINSDNGEVKNILEYKTANEDFPEELYQIYKVKEFLFNSLLFFENKVINELLVNFDEAFSLQSLLQEIEEGYNRQYVKFTSSIDFQENTIL